VELRRHKSLVIIIIIASERTGGRGKSDLTLDASRHELCMMRSGERAVGAG
jgi:hypothetical protein